MSVTREHGRPIHGAGLGPLDVRVVLNERASQARYRTINSQRMECSGVGGVNEAEIGSHAYGIASSIFGLVGRDYPTCSVDCTGVLWYLLPFDSCWFTHWLLPGRDGARGIVAG
jgi:hypothetical protein